MPKVNGFILKQIKEYETEYGYKLAGIRLALQFFHEIEGNSTEIDSSKYNAQGIGIVPFVYEKARIYYSKLYSVNESNSNKEINNIEKIVFTKPPPIKKKKMINIGEI